MKAKGNDTIKQLIFRRGPITPRRSLEPQSSTPERVAMLKKKSFNASDDELLLTVG